MCAALMNVLLQMGLKETTETLALRENQVDQGCRERKEILVRRAALEILVLLVTVE